MENEEKYMLKNSGFLIKLKNGKNFAIRGIYKDMIDIIDKEKIEIIEDWANFDLLLLCKKNIIDFYID